MEVVSAVVAAQHAAAAVVVVVADVECSLKCSLSSFDAGCCCSAWMMTAAAVVEVVACTGTWRVEGSCYHRKSCIRAWILRYWRAGGTCCCRTEIG